jgi:hypothetical protein
VLEEAFTGYFTDHHAFLLGRMLARVDAITSTDPTAADGTTSASSKPSAIPSSSNPPPDQHRQPTRSAALRRVLPRAR